jgi:hypothetical protein
MLPPLHIPFLTTPEQFDHLQVDHRMLQVARLDALQG